MRPEIARCPLCQKARQPDICSLVSHSGPNGEPLACGYPPDHDGPHSWSTLPTFTRAAGPSVAMLRMLDGRGSNG